MLFPSSLISQTKVLKTNKLKHLIQEIRNLGWKTVMQTYDYSFLNKFNSFDNHKTHGTAKSQSEFSKMIYEWRQHKKDTDAIARLEAINTSKIGSLGAYRGRNYMFNKKPSKFIDENKSITIKSLIEKASLKSKELASLRNTIVFINKSK